MQDAFRLLLGALAFPILGIILLLMPWRKIKNRMSYPLGPDGIDEEAKAHVSHTISMSYMEQTSSPRLDEERSDKEK